MTDLPQILSGKLCRTTEMFLVRFKSSQLKRLTLKKKPLIQDKAGFPSQFIIHYHIYIQICWNCGRSASETCSGCKVAKYCGAFCQHKDWENHHRVCRVQEEISSHNLELISSKPDNSKESKQIWKNPRSAKNPGNFYLVLIFLIFLKM